MYRWERRFFGLTTATKVDLFLRDIQAIMKIYPGTSYWDAYLLPVSIRKWLIEEHVRQMEQQESKPNVPLTQAEKQRFTSQVRPTTPSKPK